MKTLQCEACGKQKVAKLPPGVRVSDLSCRCGGQFRQTTAATVVAVRRVATVTLRDCELRSATC